MNNKTLFIIFIVLLGIYFGTKLFSGQRDRSFKADLITIDTAKVTALSIFPKADDHQEVILKREENGWIATQGNMNTRATPGSVNALLGNLVQVKTKRIASKSEEKWTDYEVDEAGGTRIKIYAGNKLLEDFIVGKFDFNQANRSITSYIRLAGEPEVYAVDGFLSMSFNQGFDAYRDKSLLKFNPEDISYISFSNGDEAININKTNGQWYYETTALDSAQIAGYLTNISSVTGNEFADDFDPIQATGQLAKTLSLRGNNMAEPITVSAYRIDGEQPFVLVSNINEDGRFYSDSSGIYSRIFKDISEFQ